MTPSICRTAAKSVCEQGFRVKVARIGLSLPLRFESQNQSVTQTEQPPDGSNSGITADVPESDPLDNKNTKILQAVGKNMPIALFT